MVTCEEIRKQALAVHAVCRPIMNKPKPEPKPAANESEASTGGDAGDEKTAKGGSDGKADDVRQGIPCCWLSVRDTLLLLVRIVLS